MNDLLESAVRNCAAAYGAMSQAMGRPAVRKDDVSLADFGVYRRMGFREAHRFTVWEGERAGATAD